MRDLGPVLAVVIGIAGCLFVFRPQPADKAPQIVDAAALQAKPASSSLRTPHVAAPRRIVAPRVEGSDQRSASRGALAISAGPAWSRQEVADLSLELRKAKTAPERMRVLRQLLSGMTSENALAIRDEIHKLSPSDPAYQEFHLAFGAFLGAQAVLSGADTAKPDIELAMQGWARADPAAARAWFGDQPLSSRSYFNQRYLLLGLVRGLADADSATATDFVREFASNSGPSMADEMREVTAIVAASAWRDAQELGDPQAALAWADSMPAGPLRSHARSAIAASYAIKSPEAAAAWVEGFAHESNVGPAISAAARGWTKQNPAAAMEWLAGLGENALGGYHAALWTWGRKDAVAAGQYLVDMPESSERDAAIRGFAGAIVNRNPNLALQWANSIADPGPRSASYAKTFATWARHKPVAAERQLKEMVASPTRDLAVSAYATQTAQRAPRVALNWAGSIEDAELRDQTLLETGRVVFAKNRAGFAQWLPTSGLSVELQQKLASQGRSAVQ